MSIDPEPSFVATDDNPPPDGLALSWLETGDGARLRCALAPATGPARGTITLLQGRNEALEKYFETMRDLSARGFCVATFDWRGQGGSSRLSRFASVGHLPRFGLLVEDLDRFLREVAWARCPGPHAVVAHSMGGLVALAAMPLLEPQVERLVLTAPLIALPGSAGLHRFYAAAAGLLHVAGLGHLPVRRAARAGPGTTLAGNPLTHDARRFLRNRAIEAAAPNLVVHSLSASWLRAMLRAARRFERSDTIAAMALPTLVITAGADRVVPSGASARLAWRMRTGHHLGVPGARHELLQEADRFREPVLAAIESFVGSSLPRREADETPTQARAAESETIAAP